MPNRPTISNSSCLIAMESVNLLHVLEKLYTNITVPPAVAAEAGPGLPAWVLVQSVQDQSLLQSLLLNLGAGEAEAIALSLETIAERCILDDKKARRVARQLKVPTTGTLAVLVRAKQSGLIPSVKDAIDALVAANFRLSLGLIQEALRQAGE